MLHLRTVLFWLVCSGIVALVGPFFIAVSYLDKKRRFSHKIIVFWAWCLLKIAGVRLEVQNGEILRRYPQYVIVCNHQSYFDIFCLIVILGRCPHFLAKKELFRIPIFGQALRAADVIEIDRENPDSALASIKAMLEKGLSNPVCIFPEGTRSTTGELQPFRKKGLNLLMDTGLPFVPVAFHGTREVMPKKKYTVTPGRVCFVVGEPVEVEAGMDDERKDEVRHLLWHRVKELREKARTACS